MTIRYNGCASLITSPVVKNGTKQLKTPDPSLAKEAHAARKLRRNGREGTNSENKQE